MHLNTCSIYVCARAFFNPYIYIVTPLVFCWLEDERMLPIAAMIPSELPCFIRQCFYKSCAWKTPCVCGNSWGENGLTWRLVGSASSLSFSSISRLVAYMRHALLLDAAFRRRKSRFTAVILDLTRLGHSCSFHGGRQVYIWWKPSEYNLLDID